jgi:hypothetical protein
MALIFEKTEFSGDKRALNDHNYCLKYNAFQMTVSNLIFQHIPPELLLEISETSSSFEYHISLSNALQQKIVAKSTCDKSLDLLTTTARQYQNIELQIRNNPESLSKAEKVCEKFSKYLTSLRVIKFGG